MNDVCSYCQKTKIETTNKPYRDFSDCPHWKDSLVMRPKE